MNKATKKFLIMSTFIAIISCGGGGGGGNGGTSTPTPTVTTTPAPSTPTTPPVTTTPSTPPVSSTPVVTPPAANTSNTYTSTGDVVWRDTQRVYNSSDIHNISGVTQTGNGVKVGVIDSGFNTTNPSTQSDITAKFGSRMTNINTPNTTTADAYHGIAVAEVIGGSTRGIAKNVNLYVADASVVSGSGDLSIEPVLSMYNDLYNNHGVRIFNQSFGSDNNVLFYSGNPSSPFYYKNQIGLAEMNFYKNAVTNGDALFVWSAGNDEFSNQSSLEGALPHYDNSLQKGWLNVVSLVTDDTNGTFDWNEFDVLSKAGVAKNWTVSAIGEVIYYKNGAGYVASGSSYAAPAVTGAAALIKEKYPWMGGDLLRQTILSTATDIGAEGVDNVFGWGLLDISKAIKGPSRFSKELALGNNVVLDVSAGTYTFSNDISGDAGVIKNGPGILILDGNSTFTGGTTVNAGKLKVNGTYTSEVTINPLSVFSTGENASVSNIINEGGVYENTGTNTTVTGNYKASLGSKHVALAGSTLKVEGDVELNGSTLELTNEKDGEATYITKNGVTSDVITSENGINSGFGAVETSGMLQANVTTESNSVKATLSRKDVTEYVENSDTMRNNVAQNLETAFSELDEKIENGTEIEKTEFAKRSALIQTKGLTPTTLDSLSGQIYASAQALTFQQSQTVNKDLSNRLTMLGTLENTGEKAGLWVTGITANGKLKENGYGVGKTKVNGGQAGIDKKFGDVILGTALSYSGSNVEFDRYGGKSDASNVGISVYGRYQKENNPVYVQGRAGIGFVNSEVERDIILGENDISRAKIEHNDKVYSGYLETGYDMKKNNFVFTPFIGIAHDTVQRGAFSEQNSQFGLTAEKQNYSQTSGLIGARVGQGFNWGNGSKTTLQGYVTHQVAFNDEDLSFDATYTGLSSAPFKVKGIGLSKNTTWVGVGVLNEINPAFAWYVNYDAKLEKSKGNNNVFTTGFRVNFN